MVRTYTHYPVSSKTATTKGWSRARARVCVDEEEDTCEKLSFGVFHFFHFFVHARISAGFCPFSLIFSANDSIFRAEHAPLLRRAYFLSKTPDLRVRKKVKKVKNTKR